MAINGEKIRAFLPFYQLFFSDLFVERTSLVNGKSKENPPG